VVVSVAEEYQSNRKNVVSEHLGVIFALLFDVHDQDLLGIESPLNEVIPLVKPVDFAERPPLPQSVEVKPEFGVIHNVLWPC
jgi:hypothetical protein